MDPLEYQALNAIIPLKNTAAIISMWAGDVDSTSDSTDLATVFGKLGSLDFLDIYNDGDVTLYVALGASGGTINDSARGSGVTLCWAIPAGGKESFVPIPNFGTFLYYKTASGTTVVRVRRSSLAQGMTADKIFVAP